MKFSKCPQCNYKMEIPENQEEIMCVYCETEFYADLEIEVEIKSNTLCQKCKYFSTGKCNDCYVWDYEKNEIFKHYEEV